MESWITIVNWAARLVLAFLVGLSIWSVKIMLERRKFFKSLQAQNSNSDLLQWIREGKMDKVRQWSQQAGGLLAESIRVTIDRPRAEQMEKAFQSFWTTQRPSLEKDLSVLGTMGSTTPFVGLLGTILGIIVAFGNLSSGQMDAQKIMLALAEALITTAVGLLVAIPAVVTFNYFGRKVAEFQQLCESHKDALISYFSEG